MDERMTTAIVLMGVSGSGKSTVGTALAAELGCPFIEGDDHHPPENIAKMSSGIPLGDADRAAWLETLTALVVDSSKRGEMIVLACSALKKKYRDQLRAGHSRLLFVYLRGSYNLILDRMHTRRHPYMRPELLRSQFEALEEPGKEEHDTVTFSIEKPVSELVLEITNKYRYQNRPGPIRP